jgi:spore coat protein U-like protein
MKSGGGALINYALYSNSGRTTNWGDTVGIDTVSGTGTGSAQSHRKRRLRPPLTTTRSW